MKTACILCSQNCGIEVDLEGRHLVRIRGDRAQPASQGYLCEKAQRLDTYQNARDRLTSPLRRRTHVREPMIATLRASVSVVVGPGTCDSELGSRFQHCSAPNVVVTHARAWFMVRLAASVTPGTSVGTLFARPAIQQLTLRSCPMTHA